MNISVNTTIELILKQTQKNDCQDKKISNGKLPIIGVGGILKPSDAIEKLQAGASLVQVYTGFIYNGPSFAHKINNELLKTLN